MKARFLFLIFLSFSLISCVGKTENQTDNCKCYQGKWSLPEQTPLLTYQFSNGKSISVCGYKEVKNKKEIFSEFDIFDCNTEKSLIAHTALEACYIELKEDTVVVQRLYYLPLPSQQWKWSYVPIAEQMLIADNDTIKALKETPKFATLKIAEKEQDAILKLLQNKKGIDNESETDLAKLQLLAMCGNDTAWKMLQNYEQVVGQKLDGAIKEQWTMALSTVKWLKNTH